MRLRHAPIAFALAWLILPSGARLLAQDAACGERAPARLHSNDLFEVTQEGVKIRDGVYYEEVKTSEGGSFLRFGAAETATAADPVPALNCTCRLNTCPINKCVILQPDPKVANFICTGFCYTAAAQCSGCAFVMAAPNPNPTQ